MFKDFTKPVIVFSAYRRELNDVGNYEAHLAVGMLLKSLEIKAEEISGYYKNFYEKGYVVKDDEYNRGVVKYLCKLYSQDNFLLIGADKKGQLFYIDDFVEELGEGKISKIPNKNGCLILGEDEFLVFL